MPFDPTDLALLWTSADERALRERELVLRAREVPYVVMRDRGSWSIYVPAPELERARGEIVEYAAENAGWPRRETLPRVLSGAWAGIAVYGALLLSVAYLAGERTSELQWYRRGVADAARIRSGELWRAATALTLHADVPHVLSNVFFGAVLGGLVTLVHGVGFAWLAILAAGILGNVANAWLQPGEHFSVGASTAVFAAAGILAGSEVRRRVLLQSSRLRILAAPSMAVLLLAYLGVGGERTDVLAHVTGLIAGFPVGYAASLVPRRHLERHSFQALTATLTLALLATTWYLALT